MRCSKHYVHKFKQNGQNVFCSLTFFSPVNGTGELEGKGRKSFSKEPRVEYSEGWKGRGEGWIGRGEGWKGRGEGWIGRREGWKGKRAGWMVATDGVVNERTNPSPSSKSWSGYSSIKFSRSSWRSGRSRDLAYTDIHIDNTLIRDI